MTIKKHKQFFSWISFRFCWSERKKKYFGFQQRKNILWTAHFLKIVWFLEVYLGPCYLLQSCNFIKKRLWGSFRRAPPKLKKIYYEKINYYIKCYQYIVLTNGLSSVLRVFTNALTLPLRSKGYLSVKCVDNSLFLGEIFEICFKIIRATVAVLRKLWFTIHPEKSVLVPSQ